MQGVCHQGGLTISWRCAHGAAAELPLGLAWWRRACLGCKRSVLRACLLQRAWCCGGDLMVSAARVEQ